MNPTEVGDEMRRLSSLIDKGIKELRDQSFAVAQAEHEYRRAKAEAWAMCPNDPAGTKPADRDWTSARREAWVNAETAEMRRDRDLADALRTAALEAIRSRRTQVSALQTLMNAHTAEAEFARTSPR